jgi:hypothetical protein
MQLRLMAGPRSRTGTDGQPLISGPWQASPRSTPGAQYPEHQRLQLRALCAELDHRLRRPVTAKTIGHTRQVMVLGCIGYTLDLRDKSVLIQRFSQGRAVDDFNGGMARLHGYPDVVQFVMEDLGLSHLGHQSSLLLSASERYEADEWLVANAWRLLRQDHRFKSINLWRILRALKFEPALIGLMLAARTDTTGTLSHKLSTLVWQHAAAFRHAAATNPHLLPLLAACACGHGIKQPADPIGEMRARVLDAGLSKAAWRFLVSHGAKPFREIWRRDALHHHNDWRDALQYLRLLDRLGLPNPAPSTVRGLLAFHAALEERPRMASCYGNWCKIPDHVLAPLLHESTACRHAGRASPEPDTLEKIFVWAYDTQRDLEAPPTLQWSQVLRMADEWHDHRRKQVMAQGLSWGSLIGAQEQGTYHIQPLTNAIDLIDESGAMHHCIETYIDKCVAGDIRVFSFRNARTGKRFATATIKTYGDGQWAHHDAKCKANAPASEQVHRLTAELADQYTRLDQHSPENNPPPR